MTPAASDAQARIPALWDHARARHQAGALDEAITAYQGLLDLDPNHEGALHLSALAHHQRGQNSEAKALLDRALAAAPQRPEHHALLGLVRLAETDREGALTNLKRAHELDPRNLDTLFNLGRVHQSLGHLAEAAKAYRRALEIAPGDVKSLNNLGNVLRELEDLDGALSCYDTALKQQPDAAPLLLNLGLTKHRQGALDEAIKAYRAALRSAPEQAVLHSNLADVLRDKGDLESAVGVYHRAIELDPRAAEAYLGLGYANLMAEDHGAAFEALERCQALDPRNQRAVAGRAIALQALGRDAEARAIIDLDRDLVEATLPLPDGYASNAAFAEALVEDLCHDPAVLWHEKAGRATRNGLHSENLHDIPTPRVGEMVAALERLVADYAAGLSRTPDHPHRAQVPDRYRIDFWAVRMYSGGHQMGHIHPSGWLSGVTYLQLPEVLTESDDDSQAGWIEFGRPGYGLPSGDPWPTRRIKPAVGKALLFPSYLFHHTLPYQSDTERISFAFDVVPLD